MRRYSTEIYHWKLIVLIRLVGENTAISNVNKGVGKEALSYTVSGSVVILWKAI